jgi:hypothetical protein
MLSISSTLKARAERSPETSVNFYKTIRCHIPEDIALLCEKLKSHRIIGEFYFSDLNKMKMTLKQVVVEEEDNVAKCIGL